MTSTGAACCIDNRFLQTIKFLRKLFAGFEPVVNPKSCDICEGQHEQVEQDDHEARARASLVKVCCVRLDVRVCSADRHSRRAETHQVVRGSDSPHRHEVGD